jgi:hypothetical protein
MAEILFNKAGVPLIAYGKSYQAATTGTSVPEKPKMPAQPKDPLELRYNVAGYEVSAWGASNTFPTMADTIINSVGVLNTGLKFTRNFTIGQGIFACKVTDYDEQGNEILECVKDKSLITPSNYMYSSVSERTLSYNFSQSY